MQTTFTAHQSIFINTSKAKVWDALTNPAIIKQYMFGTDTTSDWKVGSRITYTGEWDGKKYEDGGVILKIIPEEILVCTYWSSMSGTEDIPENYVTITYEVSDSENGTQLKITQDNCKTEEMKEHSEKNWGMVLGIMKEILEK